jgi:hypothetical protein
LVKQHAGSERIIVFDPSYIRKSGKKTYGLGRYWSGAAAQALKGLEMGCLACVDVAAQTALHPEAFQTPAAADRNGKSLVTLYTERIISRVQSLLTLSRYLSACCSKSVHLLSPLRFQIEFLLRDAKQHSGLEDCQARSKNKLAFHFNMSLSAVSVAKAAYYLSQPQEQRGAFSLQSIKRFYHNKLLTDMIFDNLAIELNSPKIIHHYRQCLYFGSLAD